MKQILKQTMNAVNPAVKVISMLFIFTMIFTSCTEKEVEEVVKDMDPVDTSVSAPAFTLKSLTGEDVSLSNFSNKVVVLFFFGNGCPSCKAAASSVESMLVKPFGSYTDYMVLGLDQWNGNSTSVQSFKTATSVSFPLLLNASSVATSYKTTYDRIIVIDKMHKIVFEGKNGASSDIDSAKAKVTELLTKKM